MKTNELQSKFKEYVGIIGFFLKPHGFKRVGSSFYLKENDNWVIINIQKSSKSTRENIFFTFNIGICSSTLRTFFDEFDAKIPNIDQSHFVKRIGQFLPEMKDLWFSFRLDNFKEVVSETIKIFDNYVLKEIKNMIGDDDLERHWMNGQNFNVTEFQRLLYLSVLLKKKNDKYAFQVINDLIQYARNNKLSIEYHLKKLNGE
jgi:hypothetical protein